MPVLPIKSGSVFGTQPVLLWLSRSVIALTSSLSPIIAQILPCTTGSQSAQSVSESVPRFSQCLRKILSVPNYATVRLMFVFFSFPCVCVRSIATWLKITTKRKMVRVSIENCLFILHYLTILHIRCHYRYIRSDN